MTDDLRLDEAARVATSDDVEALVWLVDAALESIFDQRGGQLWTYREARSTPATDTVTAAIDDPTQLVVVGTLDQSVVGYTMVHTEQLADDSLLAVIDDLFVLPEGRQVGVGEAVMNLVLDWAGEKGCRGIDAAALPGDRHTKNFFESNGLVARAIVVHRDLRT